jgi:PAS domain S-box-containing protein
MPSSYKPIHHGKQPVSVPDDLKVGQYRNKILVNGAQIEWDTHRGLCTFRGIPVVLMWVDSTLAGLMAGVANMVGPERFNLALQSEGRRSVASDWLLISSFPDFREGFAALNLNAAVAGWGDWHLVTYDSEKQLCVFRAYNNWEGMYQKALGVAWGSGMLAGKLSGICGKLFKTNCWATQTAFVARGDAYDEFTVRPSEKNIENEIDRLLASDILTRADMAVALKRLQHSEAALREEIAERRQIEADLQAAKGQYDRLAANIPVGVYLAQTTQAGELAFRYVSPRFCALLNVGAEEVYRDPLAPFNFIHPQDVASLAHRNGLAIRARTPFTWEGRTLVDGVARWLRIESNPEPTDDGSCLWDGIVTDIGAQKLMEHSLIKREQEMRSMLESMTDSVTRYDAHCRRIYVNPAFCRMHGGSAATLLGKKPSEAGGVADFGAYETKIGEVLASGQIAQFDLAWQNSEGRKVRSHIRLTPEFDAAGKVVSVLAIGRGD